MKYIDCEKYANEILEQAKHTTFTKTFAIVSVGDNPASQSYIKGKIKDCEYCGIPYVHKHIDLNTEPYPDLALEGMLRYLAFEKTVGSIILQLPLPDGWDEDYYLSLIPPEKDVDGFSQYSPFKPCTPEGIVYLLKKELGNLEGMKALIVGRGKLVGRPLFDLLLNENCTVTMAHSKTPRADLYYGKHDIIVTAAGVPKLMDLKICRDAKIIIDAGINRVDGKLCGDCYGFYEALNQNLRVTPVPKGVGLMTRAMLVQHIVKTNQGDFNE